MLFSPRGSLAVALAASSAVTATPHALSPVQPRHLDLSLGDLSTPTSVNISLDSNLSGLTLVEGVVVNAVVDPVVAAGAEVDLVVKCNEGYTKGDITATVSLEDLVPALSLSLKDIEAYLDLDLYVGVATTIAVNLFTPVDPIKLPIAGIELSALVYVDLVLSLDAAIDVTAGVYVKLTEEALLEIDILKGEILKADFTGLAVRTLPIEVRVGCARLQADLRVRIQAGIEAEVDINDLIPLGIDIPEIGAGLELGVYANLVEYVGLFCDTPSCPLSEESYGLNVGVAAELDVEVGDLIDLDLAPTVSIGLLTLPTTTHCQQSGGHTLLTLPPIGIATGNVPQASGSAPIPVGHGSGFPSASITGSGSGAQPSGPAGTATTAQGSDLITSTVRSTATYTYTSCAASVVNCPASYQSEQTVVKTVDVYTTVCPVTASLTAPASYSTSSSTVPKPTSSDVTVVTEVTSLVPCSSTGTFTPPAGVTPYPAKPSSAGASSTYPVSVKTSIATSPVGVKTSATSPVGVKTSSVTAPGGGETGDYPTGSVSYPAGGVSTLPGSEPTYPAGEAGNYATGSVSYPAGGASTYPGSKPSSYPAGSKPSSYPAGEAGNYPTGSSSYPAGGASTYPGSKPSSYPAGGYPGSSEVPSPSYPAGGKGSGYGNSTVPYPTAISSSYSKPSASVVYSTTKSSSPSYAASSPSSTPVAAGAGKVGSGVFGALAIAAMVLAM